MAKIEYGQIVAAASGSVAGMTFSRNRYGAYMRNKAIPVNPDTPHQQSARAALAAISQNWRGLTAAQRLQWQTWAQINPFIDSLGNAQVLQGNAAYIKLNALLAASGNVWITAPPVADAPDALVTVAVTPDATLGTCSIAFTATPLDADDLLVIRAAVLNSIGVNYVSNLYKLVEFSAKAQASPIDIFTNLTLRFGTLIVGQVVHVRLQVLDTATGLTSPPMTHSAVAV